MTDLPMSRIEEISDEVKARHEEKKGGGQELIGKILGVIIIIVAIAGFASPFVLIPLKIVTDNQKKAREDARSKAEQNYFNLLKAVETGNLDMVKYQVLEEKIPVELDGFEYESALMTAVRKGNSDIASFLLKNGADVLKKTHEGRSIMDITDEGTNIAVKRIISTAFVNTTPEDSPIWELSRAGYYYSEKTFLALIEASLDGYPDVIDFLIGLGQIKLLIKYGADVNKADKDGKTPIEAQAG